MDYVIMIVIVGVCCNPMFEPFEFKIPSNVKIINSNIKLPDFPELDLDCLKKEVNCLFLEVLSQLECGILPELEELLEKISFIDISENWQFHVAQKLYTNKGDYYPFFIGCGTNYKQIISDEYKVPYNNTFKGIYPIHANEGDRIYVIISKEQDSDISRIDMNGYTIPFKTIENYPYYIYESLNTYNEGNYTITIS